MDVRHRTPGTAPPAGGDMVLDSITDSSDEVIECNVNDVLEKLEPGYFHYMMLMICGMAFMADAMEITILSFISICAGSQWDLTSAQVASISSSVFSGILVGNLFWGPVADGIGRRNGFILGSSLIIIFGVATAFAQDYTSLLVFRTCLGFGVGGSTISFDLLAEFLPASLRGQFLTNINYFWTFGSVLVAGLAWGLLEMWGWRVLAALTAIPVCISLLWAIWVMPESPRWLVLKGRTDEAEAVLRTAAAINGTRLAPFKLRPVQAVDNGEKGVTVSDFVGADVRAVTFPLFLVWFLFGLTYYGIIFLVARIYAKDSEDESSSAYVCDFDYANIFYNAISEVVGVALTALVIDRYGRLRSQTSLYGIAGVFFFLIGISGSGLWISSVSVAARIFSMAATSVTMVVTPELFPTRLRATGHAVCSCFSRIGGFAAPFIVNSKLSVFVIAFVLALGNSVAAGSSFCLPETKHTNLDAVAVQSLEADIKEDDARRPLLATDNA